MSETPQGDGMTVDCRSVREGEWVEDYLLGRLSEPARDAFEAHFFECEECFARLEAARLLQHELRTSGVRVSFASRRTSYTRTWLATAAGLAAVAVGVGVLPLRHGPPAAAAAP